MDRICIGHSADTTDVGVPRSRCSTRASTCRWTATPGATGRPEWRERNATVKALVDKGWAHRLMLGHDYAPAPVLAGREPVSTGQPTRYLFVSNVAVPALREAGVAQADIDTMMRDVPRRFLTGEAG